MCVWGIDYTIILLYYFISILLYTSITIIRLDDIIHNRRYATSNVIRIRGFIYRLIRKTELEISRAVFGYGDCAACCPQTVERRIRERTEQCLSSEEENKRVTCHFLKSLA